MNRWQLAWLAVVSSLAVSALVGLFVAQRDISGLRNQVRTQTVQLSQDRSHIAQMQAKVTAPNHDVITCGDWQNLYLDISGTDSLGGQINAYTDSPALPSHCINH